MDTVNVDASITIYEEQKTHQQFLIRGMSAGFKKNGHNAGASLALPNAPKRFLTFNFAAYEVLIGTILNGLYNEGDVSAVENSSR